MLVVNEAGVFSVAPSRMSPAVRHRRRRPLPVRRRRPRCIKRYERLLCEELAQAGVLVRDGVDRQPLEELSSSARLVAR